MDICFLPAWFYDIEGKGGGLFFREQAIALREVVEHVSIFYPALRPDYLGREQWKLTEDNGVSIFKYQGFAFPKRIGALQIVFRRGIRRAFTLFLATRNGRRPDLLHAHSLWGAFAAREIADRWGIPFVYTEHLGKWTQDGYRMPQFQLRQLRKIGAQAAAVTAVSTGLAQRMNSFLRKQLTDVSPNMVDTELFRPSSLSTFDPHRCRFVSVGDPWRTKGLDILIHALGIARSRTDLDLQLTLVDKIPDRGPLEALIRQYNLEKHVHFAGRLNRTELVALLPNQDVLVSASRMESFGITMIEGLACGLPVLATHTAGARDIVGSAQGLLVPREDAEALAEGILTMVQKRDHYDPEFLAAYAHEHFGKAAFNARWCTRYADLLKAPVSC